MSAPELKPLTIAALKAAGACSEGLSWITPLIENEDPLVAEKLLEHDRDWWNWAIEHDFDVYTPLSDECRARHEMGQIHSNSGNYGSSSNSGNYGSSSNSGYGGSSSNSGYRGSSSNSGNYGSSSNSGNYGSSSNSGEGGFAVSMSVDGRVRGEIPGTCLVAGYWTDDGKVARVATGVTGENGIEVDVWYTADPETGQLKLADNQSEPKTGPEAA